MPQPHLFRLNVLHLDSTSYLGTPPTLRGRIPMSTNLLYITGVTKDSTGAALGFCTVQLFRTDNDQMVEEIVSDASGAYSLRVVAPCVSYYVVAYKAGVPDVAGTTVNTLVGAGA